MRAIHATILGLATTLAPAVLAPAAHGQDAPPPHVIRTSTGGYVPEPGYTWTSTDTSSLAVRWTPGLAHPLHANVVSGGDEGQWAPAPGFRWSNDVAGDFSVVPLAGQPDPDAVARAIVKILGAGLADAASQPAADDDLITGLFRGLARVGRDELIESAVRDVFPSLADGDVRGIRRVICLGLDGQLNEQNWRTATARDELIARLRREDVNLATVAQVVDFVAQVQQARQSAGY